MQRRLLIFLSFTLAMQADGAVYNAVLDGKERKFMVFDQRKTMMRGLKAGTRTLLQKRASSFQLHTQAQLAA